MKRKSLIGYIGSYWSLHWEDENNNCNHHGKGTRQVTLLKDKLKIYKTLKDGVFPIAFGHPTKVKITIEEI